MRRRRCWKSSSRPVVQDCCVALRLTGSRYPLTIPCQALFFGGGYMIRPQRRKPVNKYRSASKFRHGASKTKGRNLIRPMRGGIRA